MKVSEQKGLMEAARTALRFSYSPYSNFRVGAAVLTKSGSIITGCNVENSSYGLTVCAERVAIFNAVSHGEREILALAIACSSGKTCLPCGACRQVIWEFAKNAQIVIDGEGGKLVIKSAEELLPMAFSGEGLFHRGS